MCRQAAGQCAGNGGRGLGPEKGGGGQTHFASTIKHFHTFARLV